MGKDFPFCCHLSFVKRSVKSQLIMRTLVASAAGCVTVRICYFPDLHPPHSCGTKLQGKLQYAFTDGGFSMAVFIVMMEDAHERFSFSYGSLISLDVNSFSHVDTVKDEV